MDRLAPGEFPPQPPEHVARYLTIGSLKRLLRRSFRIVRAKSILPVAGQRGILRLIHSYTLNRAVELFIPRQYITALKEHAGFGYQFIILAQKKS